MIRIKVNVTQADRKPGMVLLDSWRELLSNVREGDVLLVIEGITIGNTKSTRLIGDMGSFGTVFLCEKIKVSVLSFIEVRDRANFEYLASEDQFVVACSNAVECTFCRYDMMYATYIHNHSDSEQRVIEAPVTV